MIKDEGVKEISNQTGVEKSVVKKTLEAFMQTGKFSVANGKNVYLRGFGSFIVKPLAFAFPDDGYEPIKEQFMLGDEILVAPIVEKGARSRTVVFPKGKW